MSYIVQSTQTTEVVCSDPIELRYVECWSVTRVTDGMGWHIGRYGTAATAREVADFLTAHTEDEVA